jgi:CBS domain-containing protein
MSTWPMALPPEASVMQAARIMHDRDTGDVVVTDSRGRLNGILTDRDIVTRVVAAGRKPDLTAIRDVLTPTPVTVQPDTEAVRAVALMRENAVRRLPVVDGAGVVVGIVSLGDLAIDRDSRSVLAAISAARPNN